MACLLFSSGSIQAIFSISAMGWFSWHQGLSSSQYFGLCPVCWCTSWQLSLRHLPYIPKMVGLPPCRRFSECWSLHPMQCVPDSFFRTATFLMSFVSMPVMCGFHERRVLCFTPRKVGVATWGSVLSPGYMATFLWRFFFFFCGRSAVLRPSVHMLS